MNTFAKILILFFITLLHVAALYAESGFVGVMVDGFIGSCTVRHNNEVYNCSAHKDLHIGDIIQKKPSLKELEIKFDPSVELKKLSADRGAIVYQAVPSNLNVLKWIKGFINKFLNPIEFRYFTAATKGPEDGSANEDGMCDMLEEQPYQPINLEESGQFFTAIYAYKEPIEFSWTYDLTAIVFEKSDKNEIFRNNIKEINSIKLSPKKIGLKRGETYTWYYEYNDSPLAERYMVNLLDKQTEKTILDSLKLIAKQTKDETEKIIKQSAYLQLFSDANPEIDLYWLSYQMLPKDVSRLNRDHMDLICKLKFRYTNYLENVIK